MAIEKRAILVAGGAGYIGSHTVKYLANQGYEPVILDNLSTGNRWGAQGHRFYEGQIGDCALLARILGEHQIAGAILFAGHAYVGESTQNPRKYYENNICQSLAFAGALLDGGVRNLVFSSSCSIYGQQGQERISEELPKDPLSPYAETKYFFERMLFWYGKAYGLRHACLRYFNASGADAEGELGEQHDPETHLIPLTIQAAMGGKPLQVFGDDYPTADGTAIRDYIHVTDLAAAHERALDYLLAGGDSFVVNLGSGTGYSVREVIAMVEKVTGRPVPHRFAPRREGDAPCLVANAERAARLLNWQTQHSSLENIVRTAWAWHQKAAQGLA